MKSTALSVVQSTHGAANTHVHVAKVSVKITCNT